MDKLCGRACGHEVVRKRGGLVPLLAVVVAVVLTGTGSALAATVITTSQIANRAVTNPKIASNAVSSAKIATGAVSPSKLSSAVIAAIHARSATIVHGVGTVIVMTCPTGYVVAGGGWYSGINNQKPYPYANYPLSATQWEEDFNYTSDAYAVCIR